MPRVGVSLWGYIPAFDAFMGTLESGLLNKIAFIFGDFSRISFRGLALADYFGCADDSYLVLFFECFVVGPYRTFVV